MDKVLHSSVVFGLRPQFKTLEGWRQGLHQLFRAFLKAHDKSPAARDIVEEHQQEIELYEQYGEYFGYIVLYRQ
ncbi:hypothetical protein BWR19_02840 [Halomonas sp. 1513]|nr:hypothetical protein [Halomonas sp. 1513]APX91968.1 hypothetical protein BWR19_02840 [Halomonas sp. 1513]